MIIEREDINRMKELARWVAANERNHVGIHEREVGFKNDMAAKYGEKEAIRMLTKVWKLSKELQEDKDVSSLD